MRQLPAALALAALAACAPLQPPGCRAGESAMVLDSLYFGTSTPAGSVTAAEWDDFLGSVVTPRFPQGLTVLQAAGQWQTAAGAVLREASQVLQVVHADDAATDTAVQQVVAAYKARFRQDSVLRVRSTVCATF